MSIEKRIMKEVRMLLNLCDLDYDPADFIIKMLIYGLGFAIGVGLIFFNYSIDIAFLAGEVTFFVFEIFIFALLIVTANRRTAVIEETLPDFLGIMASNIRSGITYDRALLLSARKEFGPLAKEIDKAAKETIAGKPLTEALMDMTNRIRSEIFSKTIRLIVEGVNSGGKLADLLENTALDIRRFSAIRKEVSATVLIYQLFMFAAAAVGAPLLYAVANFLIKIVSTMRQKIGVNITAEASAQLPFFKATSVVSPELIFLFSIFAIVITAFFGALAAGVISRGKESEGFSYIPILLIVSLGVFFIVGFLLETLLKGLFFV